LYALGGELDGLVDVTIIYSPAGEAASTPNLWQLVTGQVPEIVVRAELIEIQDHLRGRNFRSDNQFRRDLRSLVNQMWRDKDELISSVRNQGNHKTE